MSSLLHSLQVLLSEPWLACSRWATVQALEHKVRQRAAAKLFAPEPGSMLYVAASALPYHTSGYTIRTHELIQALAVEGKVYALTRPGYPTDRKDRLRDVAGDETCVGAVHYLHVPAPANNRPVLLYALQAASVIAKKAQQIKVAVIHAASNHVNALPALLAARQLGIPFQYEMRGLWELTRISRMPWYERRQGFKQSLQLEGLVARHADKVFVISQQLGRFAQDRWGIRKEQMFLLPNCVNPERFVPADPQAVEAGMIGYAGSLIGYEGLDILFDAVARLAARKITVKVNIAGEGEARPALEAQVQTLGLSGQIRFLGRVSPEQAQETIRRCAVVCIPRKPFKVCEIVPPIKLVEALAMGKPVIVPDLPVFRDELGDAPAGWFFKAGDADDLALTIERAVADQSAMQALGIRAREYALAQRNWRNFVMPVLPTQQDEV
jgi:glycosyltransferase involved in cell wall biosynthesis